MQICLLQGQDEGFLAVARPGKLPLIHTHIRTLCPLVYLRLCRPRSRAPAWIQPRRMFPRIPM